MKYENENNLMNIDPPALNPETSLPSK